MRKIQYFISAAVIALGLASCSKEPVETADRQITIVANTESGVDTKTSLSGDDQTGYQVLWSEGDEIVINNGSFNLEFALTRGAGTSRGEFASKELSSNFNDGFYGAFYATDGEVLSSESQYIAGGMISSAPMYATVFVINNEMAEMEFKNLCGLLRLKLKGRGTVKEIKVSADQYLSGEFIPDGYTATITNGSTKYVTLDCGDGVDLTEEGTDFYISLPQYNYTGVVIEIKDFTGHTCTKTLKSDKVLNIARAQITPVSLNVTGLESNIPGALAGVFTVNDKGKKVHFSKGNMYWNGNSFEFETLQSGRQTVWNQHHVNHFYWSFWDEEASAKDYKVTGPIGIFPNEEYDNSKARESFTVNGVTGKYRVLTYFEWKYLFEHHSRKWVTVNGIPGYVVAPDGVELDSRNSYSNVELNTGDLVFLPVTGIRNGDIIDKTTSVGYYWTSSSNQDNEGGYMYLTSDGVDQGAILNYACCIRLVVDIE